jgi:flagellar hook assembly protein FlgD
MTIDNVNSEAALRGNASKLHQNERNNDQYLKELQDARKKTNDPEEIQRIMHPEKADSMQKTMGKMNLQADTFMHLFLKTLQCQTPDNTVDIKDMTETIAQISQTQAMFEMNQRMKAAESKHAEQTFYSAMSMLGNEVELKTDKIELKDGFASFTYEVPKGSEFEKVKTLITNQDGQIILERNTQLNEGWNRVDWDGIDQQDVQKEDGIFNIHVVGIDKDNETTELEIHSKGTIAGAERKNGKTYLNIGNQEVFLDKVTKITRPADTPRAAISSDQDRTEEADTEGEGQAAAAPEAAPPQGIAGRFRQWMWGE